MNKHRAQHRLRTQPARRLPRINPLWRLPPWWFVVAFTVMVCAGILTIAIRLVSPPSPTPQVAAAATTALARPDPTTTETSRAFLAALAAEHVAIEPHQAVLVGEAVCGQRERYNASPFTLQAQIRTLSPGLRAIDVATLVDKGCRVLMSGGQMIRTFAVSILLVTTSCASPTGLGATAQHPAAPTQSSQMGAVSSRFCDESLWSHVYNPARLKIVNRCVTVTGVIEVVRTEADGDNHILLRVDPPYAGMVNSVNVAKQHGDLVLEPVCEGVVTQADAKEGCAGYHSPISVPPVGSHVRVVGAHVTDSQHAGWGEIHPVTSIVTVP